MSAVNPPPQAALAAWGADGAGHRLALAVTTSALAALCVTAALSGQLPTLLLGTGDDLPQRARWLGWMLGLSAAGLFACEVLGAALAWPLQPRQRAREGSASPSAVARAGRLGEALTALLHAAPGALLVGVLHADARLYCVQAMHLDDDFVLTGMRAGNADESHLGAATWLTLGASLLAVACGLALLRRGVGHVQRRRPRLVLWVGLCGALGVGAAYAAAAGSARAALRRDDPGADLLPLARRLLSVDRSVAGAVRLQHPGPAAVAGWRAERTPDILLVQVESWRADSLDPRWMPRLSALRETLPCARSGLHFAGSHTTVWSTFALLYGLDAVLFTPMAEAGLASAPLNALQRNGYTLHGVSASQLRGWDRGDLMVSNFGAHYEEHLTGDVPARDRSVSAALAHLLAPVPARSARSPLFIFGFLYAPHHNYHFPPEHARHLPVLPVDYNHFAPDDQLAHHATEIWNRYRNALDFVDAELAGLLEPLRERIRSGDLVVAITGDHGEEFWDHGAVGHGAARFWNARTAVPLLLCGRGLEAIDTPLSSHADLLPTLLDLLGGGFDDRLPTFTTARSLLRRAPQPDALIIGVGYPFGGDGLATASVEGDRVVKRWWRRDSDALAPRQVKRTDGDDRDLPPDAEADADAARALQRRLQRFLGRSDAVVGDVPDGFDRVEVPVGDAAVLVAVRVEGAVRAGGALRVELLWRRTARGPPLTGALFCHLLRQRGAAFERVRNLDEVAAHSALPLAAWPEAGLVRAVVHVELPSEAAKGLVLRVGLVNAGGARVGAGYDVPLPAP